MPTYISKTAQPNVKYAITVSLKRKSASVVACSVSCTANLVGDEDYLGTGHKLVGYLDIPGVGEKSWTIKGSSDVWTGTGTHKSSGGPWNMTVSPEETSVSGFKFRVSNTYGTAGDLKWQSSFASSVAEGLSYVREGHSAVVISGEALDQTKAVVVLSDIRNVLTYERKIDWYVGTELVRTDAVNGNEHSFELTGLAPNTSYNVTAELRIDSDTSSLIVAKSVNVTTPQETGNLELAPKATYITAALSEMFDLPNYERTIEFYYKKDEEADYKLFSTEKAQGDSISKNITGLISNSVYDVKILIKNGATTLKTLTDQVETLEDTSLIPTAMIEQITQRLGTRLCTISWTTDKAVAGTTYVVEAKADGEWEEFASMSEVISPVTVELDSDGMGNADVTFRIRSVNESVAEGLVNCSEEVVFYVRDDFLWDSEKIAGQPLIITASEWNRLREYAIARNNDRGNTVDIPIVRKDDAITAAVYNTMKNAISLVTPIAIADKRRGDAITAADIDALRVAINTVA